jgi:Fibronectin type III domain.
MSEGPIQGYVVYVQLTEDHLSCTFNNNCSFVSFNTTNETTTEINFLNLDLHSNYSVWLAAFTEAGTGPFSEYITVMTGSYGMLILCIPKTSQNPDLSKLRE